MRAEILNQPIFLFGNGINRAVFNGVKSWTGLLEDLSRKSKIEIDLDNEFKPFPLIFEEILFKKKGDYDDLLKEIKKDIATVFKKTPSNELHQLFVESPTQHILTTNYDYAFEKVMVKNFYNQKGETQRQSTEESLNSIRRRSILKRNSSGTKQSDLLNIWHIHGEINQRLSPSKMKATTPHHSIMIGFEHYGIYQYEIQKYIRGERTGGQKPILDKVKDKRYSPESWIDFFFMGNLHIAGIGLDFSENHLWWLLNYRAKEIKKGNLRVDGFSTIHYYYPETEEVFSDEVEKYLKTLLRRKNNKARNELLESLGVNLVPIKIKPNDYKAFYQEVYKRSFAG